ncbi:hypothetical protein CV103_17950 [Sphingomonas fennica]|uniref:Uncharacterized protein n=1 Tax=Edaphosphingomonas fennica TaxID=114404 RepID=A0A2T4HNJ2_9SPHN|nr:hypothetical protein CV103_17950 [Sphingomonas fennica]
MGAACLALLPQTLLSGTALAQAKPAPAAKPGDRDAFCFIATAASLAAMRQNEAKLTEDNKKALPALVQAVPFFAGRVTKRVSGDALTKVLRDEEATFRASNRGVEAVNCLNIFSSGMKTIIEATQPGATKASPAPAQKK